MRFSGRQRTKRVRAQNYDFVASHKIKYAATRHAAERGKCACVRIEQHLVTPCGICDQPEGAAGVQFDVGDFETAPQTADEGVLTAYFIYRAQQLL
ncbi:hypothetical protein QF001_004983 [Paraburkholderia youngii]